MVASIPGISTSSAPPPSSPPTNELGRDSFVRLLLTQLQSQDPTAPQSSEDFVAQLAQFTSVELLEKQSGHLEALLVAQAANNQIGVSSLVGKDVSFAADSITTTAAGEQRKLKLDIPSAADTVIVTVKDADGRVVRTMNVGARAAGQSELNFDGLGDDGNPLPAGTYALSVTATAGGSPVEAMLFERGAVEGVSFINGIAELMVAGRKVRLPDVIEVNEPTGDAAP